MGAAATKTQEEEEAENLNLQQQKGHQSPSSPSHHSDSHQRDSNNHRGDTQQHASRQKQSPSSPQQQQQHQQQQQQQQPPSSSSSSSWGERRNQIYPDNHHQFHPSKLKQSTHAEARSGDDDDDYDPSSIDDVDVDVDVEKRISPRSNARPSASTESIFLASTRVAGAPVGSSKATSIKWENEDPGARASKRGHPNHANTIAGASSTSTSLSRNAAVPTDKPAKPPSSSAPGPPPSQSSFSAGELADLMLDTETEKTKKFDKEKFKLANMGGAATATKLAPPTDRQIPFTTTTTTNTITNTNTTTNTTATAVVAASKSKSNSEIVPEDSSTSLSDADEALMESILGEI